jgi:two-component system chemotaxis response regulator CheY
MSAAPMSKILIIDDSQTARAMVKRSLKDSGHDFLEAAGGTEAMEILAKENGIGLILCDVNMPDIDGLSLCTKIMEKPEFKHLKILMITTEASLEMKKKGKEIGVLGWVTKPFDATKFAMTVDKILAPA